MADPFATSYLKIDRAKKHLGELTVLVQAYLNSRPVTYKVTIEPDGARFRLSGKGLPVDASAIIGDIFHNLRSALDLMAAELCGTPGRPDPDARFPFCAEEAELDRMIKRRNFDRAGDAAIRLIKEWKPYKGGNVALRAIHDLNIRDKHRMLIINPVSYASPIIDTRAPGGWAIVGDPSAPSEIKLAFPADCALAKQELIPTLHSLVDLTARIVESFKALRTPTG